MFKKTGFIILSLLIIISMYKDLTIGTTVFNEPKTTLPSQSFTVIKVKVQPGDTILSITEQVNNNQLTELDISQVIMDFTAINSHVDPYELKVNTFYYFPLY